MVAVSLGVLSGAFMLTLHVSAVIVVFDVSIGVVIFVVIVVIIIIIMSKMTSFAC